MRILHVDKYLFRSGGAEGYMEDVAALQRQAGHDVWFWGMSHPENVHLELSDTFAPYVDLRRPRGPVGRARTFATMVWSRKAALGLAEAIRRVRPDVAHLHNLYHHLTPSVLGPLRDAGVPMLMTLHDYKLVCPTYLLLADGRPCEACVPHRYWNAPLRRCGGSTVASGAVAIESAVHTALGLYRGVGVFVCPSRFMQDMMTRGRLPADRLHHLAHFVDTAGVDPKEVPGADAVIAGRLSKEKGVDVAIRAAAGFPDGLRLQVAGDGPLRADLERLAAAEAPGKVTFHGRLDKPALLRLLRSSSVAVVPSTWYENQPMAVLEAFACGLPVVGTTLGGVPELVTPGVDGLLVPPGDAVSLGAAVTSIATDRELAARMGAAGRARVERDFTPGAHLEGLVSLYALAADHARG